jgi:hypothetical protein
MVFALNPGDQMKDFLERAEFSFTTSTPRITPQLPVPTDGYIVSRTSQYYFSYLTEMAPMSTTTTFSTLLNSSGILTNALPIITIPTSLSNNTTINALSAAVLSNSATGHGIALSQLLCIFVVGVGLLL